MNLQIEEDINLINRIDAVHLILKTLRRITRMRISLIARIADGKWTACAVHDDAGFGLQVGESLDLSSTY